MGFMSFFAGEQTREAYELDVRRHLRDRLHLRDYVVDRTWDERLKWVSSYIRSHKLSPVAASITFALELYAHFLDSDDDEERDAASSLSMALKFEIPHAAMMGDIEFKLEKMLYEQYVNIIRADTINRYGINDWED